MRGSDATVFYAKDPDADDPEADIANRCDVGIDEAGGLASKAIGEIGEIFGSNEGQTKYCDWACENGDALVRALAACAL